MSTETAKTNNKTETPFKVWEVRLPDGQTHNRRFREGKEPVAVVVSQRKDEVCGIYCWTSNEKAVEAKIAECKRSNLKVVGNDSTTVEAILRGDNLKYIGDEEAKKTAAPKKSKSKKVAKDEPKRKLPVKAKRTQKRFENSSSNGGEVFSTKRKAQAAARALGFTTRSVEKSGDGWIVKAA